MAGQLSQGCIHRMHSANDTSGPFTLQVLDVKQIGWPGGGRFRLVISDGQCYMQGILATQNNHMVAPGQVRAALVALSLLSRPTAPSRLNYRPRVQARRRATVTPPRPVLWPRADPCPRVCLRVCARPPVCALSLLVHPPCARSSRSGASSS